jgi:ribosomal protein L37AE/L43A
MRRCFDCERPTRAKPNNDGIAICRKCKKRRREAWERRVEQFQRGVEKVWRSIREREGQA